MNMCVRVNRGLVVAGLLLGIVLFGVGPGPAFAAPAETGVGATSVVVEGNRRVEADTIRSYFKVAPGERLDAAKIDSALKALYASGLFKDIRISQSGGRLVVTVSPAGETVLASSARASYSNLVAAVAIAVAQAW